MYVYFICNISRAYRPLCEHMRALAYDASAYNVSICDVSACTANARIRITSHANAFLMCHARIRIRYMGVFRVRYARICVHSHAMPAHSHRMRSHSLASNGNARIQGELMRVLYCICKHQSIRLNHSHNPVH